MLTLSGHLGVMNVSSRVK